MKSMPESGNPHLDEEALKSLLAPEKMERMADELRCAARHLAVATSKLSRDGEVPRETAIRYASAEALFRALADEHAGIISRPAMEGPFVRLLGGAAVPLTLLFSSICQRDRLWLPERSIDPDLVHAAKEILQGLEWHLPGETILPP